MFRLANFPNEKEFETDELYQYVSGAISETIAAALTEYLSDDMNCVDIYESYFLGFFRGLENYVKGKYDRIAERYLREESDRIGFTFIKDKMARMKEKVLDKKNNYTFDVLEERILFFMCQNEPYMEKRIPQEKKTKIAEAEKTLRTKYGFLAREAKDFAQKMYRLARMPLKDDEDDNIIFWDDDYEFFFWEDLSDGSSCSFLSGIERLKSYTGESRGYGYQYACEIFSDIGIKPPLRLFGTEEANRIRNEVQKENVMKAQEEFFRNIMNRKID